MTEQGLIVADEVATALAAGRPVVALETTLVTHGLPQPHGLRVAHALEAAVREAGATPATIGILAGAVRVGLSSCQLAALAAARNGGQRLHGLRIGGVHRDAAESGDVSADLTALARHPVAVVCAGAKAILDLPRTREMLETLGVPVLGLGTSEFPAFYRRSSGLAVDARCDSPTEAAAALAAHFTLGLPGGLVVANPIPAGQELPADLHDTALATALADATAAGVRGRDVTPFLLERMRVLTGDASLRANEALLVNNARAAAQIAVALRAAS